MKSRLPLAFGMAGLVGAGMVLSLNAEAQQPAPAASPPAAAATPAPAANADEHQRPKLSAQDRAAFFDARIAALHAGLALTADQEKLWPPVETAMRDMAKARVEMHQKMHGEGAATDPVQRLERMSDRVIARGEGLKKLADAAGPLYKTLTDEQKHRLPMLLHAMRESRMREHFAMMREGGGHGHWGWWRRHEDHGWRDNDHGRGRDRDDRGGGRWNDD